jgi:hypothetical protein
MKPASHEPDISAVPFGANDVRLSPRAWLVATAIALGLLVLISPVWRWIEPLRPGADYRIPYRLGNDYWMFDHHLRAIAAEEKTLLLGDSVIWGHYVDTRGTLAHYLNEKDGRDRFANLGVDGIHPVAMDGLVRYYGGEISGRNVVLHCNLLWTADKRRDLSVEKEFAFNHPRLAPQFTPRIPCYRESLSEKIAIVVQRELPFSAWSTHLRIAYFDNLDVPRWTIDHPSEDPLAAITLKLPSPDEPPSPPPVAQPWTARRIAKSNFPWVELETSLQWAAFRRTVETLQGRGNRLFVLVGPLNEHMLTDASRQTYDRRKAQVAAWLLRSGIPHHVAPVLPSELYADASHPLAEGYALLAQGLLEDGSFVDFLAAGKARPAN